MKSKCVPLPNRESFHGLLVDVRSSNTYVTLSQLLFGQNLVSFIRKRAHFREEAPFLKELSL